MRGSGDVSGQGKHKPRTSKKGPESSKTVDVCDLLISYLYLYQTTIGTRYVLELFWKEVPKEETKKHKSDAFLVLFSMPYFLFLHLSTSYHRRDLALVDRPERSVESGAGYPNGLAPSAPMPAALQELLKRREKVSHMNSSCGWTRQTNSTYAVAGAVKEEENGEGARVAEGCWAKGAGVAEGA